MNNKTLLGLAAIMAITIMVVAGLYFNSQQKDETGKVSVSTETSAPQVEESAASTVQMSEDIAGTDPAEPKVNAAASEKKSHTPTLLGFEFDLNLDSTGTIESMIPYRDLPGFEQAKIREYQSYIFDKTAKDTGKSVNDFSLQERGAMETEDPTHSVYVYKFHTGSDCEVHMVDIDANTGDYQVSYNYC